MKQHEIKTQHGKDYHKKGFCIILPQDFLFHLRNISLLQLHDRSSCSAPGPRSCKPILWWRTWPEVAAKCQRRIRKHHSTQTRLTSNKVGNAVAIRNVIHLKYKRKLLLKSLDFNLHNLIIPDFVLTPPSFPGSLL